MKKIILFVAVVGMAVVASAQVSFNVKAGLGFSTFYGAEKIDLGQYGSMGYNPKLAWKVGVGIECALSRAWSIAPSLYYLSAGTKSDEYSVPVENGSILKMKETVSLNYIQIPINIQWRTPVSDNVNLVVYAGPYFAFGVGGKDKMEVNGLINRIPVNVTLENDSFEDIELYGKRVKGYETFDFGLNYGVNLECSHFIVGLNMDLGLTKIHEIEKSKNLGAALMVGYKF